MNGYFVCLVEREEPEYGVLFFGLVGDTSINGNIVHAVGSGGFGTGTLEGGRRTTAAVLKVRYRRVVLLFRESPPPITHVSGVVYVCVYVWISLCVWVVWLCEVGVCVLRETVATG